MKTTLNMLLVGMMAAFCCSIGSAQIVYSNAFNGSATTIMNTAPDVANTFAGGSSSAVWHDGLGANGTGFMGTDGITATTNDNAWTLPFTPMSGYTYTLSATLTFTGNPGSWVGIGFAQNWSQGQVNGHGGFKDSASGDPNGYDFMILTESSGNVQAFKGPHATQQIYSANGTFTANTPAAHTVQVILDTTTPLWSVGFSVDGSPLTLSSSTYGSNPSIGAVGITQNNSLNDISTYQWSDFSLTADAVPEPSALALAGFGLAGIYTFLRRRK